MEKLRKRSEVRQGRDYLIWKLSYVAQKVFDNDVVASDKIKTSLTLNKPVHVETCILNLVNCQFINSWSGLWLHWKRKKRKKSLLFTYSQSLVYEFETKTVYNDLSKNEVM